MPLRLFLILTLLLQPVAWPVAMSRVRAAECAVTSCCVVVETTGCCGEAPREIRCGKTGGPCRCGVQARDSEPAPAAPAPAERNELGPVPVAAVVGVIHGPAPSGARAPAAPPSIRRPHNETQALLCIWRT